MLSIFGVALGVAVALGSESAPLTLSCHTTRGPFTVSLRPDLCQNGTAQLMRLTESGFLSQGLAFFRINKGIVQFGADESPVSRKRRGASDPFGAVRHGTMRDWHPKCGLAGDCSKPVLKEFPWSRGTFALISSTQMLVVKRRSRVMGTNRFDCPLGTIDELGMTTVFDQLYSGYGNKVDTKTGPGQGTIARQALEGTRRSFPKLDFLLNCTQIRLSV